MIAKNINDLLGKEVTNKDYYNIKEIVVADNVENIYTDAFAKFRKLTSVIISNSVRKIDNGAFRGCRNLISVELSGSVREIGSRIFQGCFALESIVVHNNNPIFDSRDNCNAIIKTENNTLIFGCKKTIFPDGIKKIDPSAFRFTPDLHVLRIPESLHFFSINTISNRSAITSIEVDNNNTIFDSRGNCNAIIRKKGNSLIYGCNYSTIPYGIESIGYRAFDGCTDMSSIYIPDSVTSIDANAFSGCTNMTSVEISKNATYIGERAFQDCGKLDKITIPGKVECIGSNAFCGCVNLTSVVISEGVKTLNPEVFAACCSMEKVYLPKSVEKIATSAFRYCNNLQSIIIPEGTLRKFLILLPNYKDKLIEQ